MFLNLIFGNNKISCGSQIVDDNSFRLEEILSQNKQSKNYVYNNREDYWTPIAFHIVRNSNSDGGVPLYRLDQGISDLNLMYDSANLHFYQRL